MQKIFILYLVGFCLLLMYPNTTFSQCAGQDNTITLCAKESNNSYQSFDLYSQLNGSPETGGTWSSNNPIFKNALNSNTGILNLWKINQYGEHKFTYTNNTCGESAEITIFLGGYSGEDNINGGANACSDDVDVDLFTFLDNNSVDLNADLNGIWSEDPSTRTGFLNDNLFNASLAGVGTYTFIYTVEQVDTCPSKSTTVILEVHRAPESGEATDIVICDTDDLTPYTNIDLFDQIINEDLNGIWTDDDNTNQITSPSDSIIDIQDIYNNFGSGEYSFTYTVQPTHGVCSAASTTVTVKLPQISGKFEVSDTCISNTISIGLIHTNPDDVDMLYDLGYEIVNTNTNQVVYSETINDVKTLKIDNTTNNPSFTLPKNSLLSGNYIIRTSSISNLSGLTCSSYTVSETSFSILDAKINIEDICYNNNIINATIFDLIDNTGTPSNETFIVDLLLTDTFTSEAITVKNQQITFTNGETNFSIDLSPFSEKNTNYNIKITSASNQNFGCINHNFTVKRVPDNINLDIAIDNICNAGNVSVIIDAPLLPDGQYIINYEITRPGSSDVLTKNSITFNGGKANYQVDISNLEKGVYNVILKSSQNDTNVCRTKFDFEVSKNFSIDGIPSPPTLNDKQTFCLPDFSPNLPTISDIKVDSGENLTWYADINSTDPLPVSTVLVNGEDYFVSATGLNNCESSEKSSVTITLLSPQTVTAFNTSPIFCDIDDPSISNLDAQVDTGELLWYDSPTGGNLLDSTTLLTNSTTYYATESIQGCESITRLAYTVTIITPPTPVLTGLTELCQLDESTLLDFESSSLSTDPNFEIRWYDSSENGVELDKLDLLEANITYYIANVDPDSGCESKRLPITVSLNNCDPEKYDFFIPDGFSPNGDGVNDYYFIPYIEYFYPNYQLEIFNRYGQSLFKGNSTNPKWDGTNSSSRNEVTSGVYFYILNYNKDNLKPKQGRIYLSK
ncbi:gliding motility-associated C-terminal domain-containing protein [Tenacibaculum discolor]|uniref:gliding motility-associated C-terminal domain-containing protein n=1 Tax=Tenacibaculum discolor TaxID=361581 RepID=UPI003F7927F2